jgi:hypothetical protein
VTFRPASIRGVHPGEPGVIDYRLARQGVIREFKKGRLSRIDVCDAHPELMRAARNVGQTTTQPCPICENSPLVLVSYAFGPKLPASGRCLTSDTELPRLARQAGEVACYVVEVCPDCGWNHLDRSFSVSRKR